MVILVSGIFICIQVCWNQILNGKILNFIRIDGDDIPGIGQYEDFHTIDWQRDIARDRMRHRYIVKKVQDSLWDFFKVRIQIK